MVFYLIFCFWLSLDKTLLDFLCDDRYNLKLIFKYMMKSPFENDKKTKKGQFSIYKSFFFAVSCVVKLLLEVC